MKEFNITGGNGEIIIHMDGDNSNYNVTYDLGQIIFESSSRKYTIASDLGDQIIFPREDKVTTKKKYIVENVRTLYRDTTPTDFGITDIVDVTPLSSHFTEEIIVGGINELTPVIAPVGVVIYINDVVSASGSTVSDGDTVKFEITAPESGISNNIDLSIGDISKSFSISALQAIMSANGGVVTQIDDNGTTYKIHTFTSNGSLVIDEAGATGDIEYLIVAGGGGGGCAHGGGGGAGGMLTGTKSLSAGTYPIVIGDGGLGATSRNASGGSGSNSVAFSETTIGGGGGGSRYAADPLAGGSGGGGGYIGGGALGSVGQGNAGGNSHEGSGSGGGGAGAAGTDGNSGISAGVAGGIGLQSDINGTNTYYAGGGGSGVYASGLGGAGGAGGGGAGGDNDGGVAGEGHDASANTGGGGGGGAEASPSVQKVGGDGGSGIVIVRYAI